jgi:arylsulfatase A
MPLRHLCLLTAAILAVAPPAADAESPNIVYFILDEWGYYEWSGMGHPILETPHIDQFAQEGMRFTQMLAGGNVCAPTRCSLLTGKHGGHITVRANGGGSAIRRDEVTVSSLLNDAGYACGGFGKWGIGARGSSGVPELHGFDLFFGYYHQVHAHTYYPAYLVRNSEKVALPGNSDDMHNGSIFSQGLIHAEALQFIRDHKDEPFFAYLPYTLPHGHWGMPADDPSYLKYKNREFGGKNQRGEHDQQMYAAMVEMADRQLGDILGLLQELKLDENTIVFVSGDNGGQAYFKNESHPDGVFRPNVDPRSGTRFRGGKGNFYEGGLRVPYLVRWPGKIEAGSSTDHLCYFPDVLPTLAELAGTSVPPALDGISFVPTLLGPGAAGQEAQQEHEFLYWEMGEARAIRQGKWKAIKPAGNKPWELYNLDEDISELTDLAEEHGTRLQDLEKHANTAHSPIQPGEIYDPELAFKKQN